jgi:hypothetical protein
MPQDNPRTESPRTEQQQRGGGSRSEQMRGENMAAAETFTGQFSDLGKRSINAGLRMQTEMFEALHALSRDWVACTTSEAELALNLPNRLAGARSIPQAITAYQGWLGDLLTMCSEDGRRLMADGQKFMTSGVRCFADASTGGPN